MIDPRTSNGDPGAEPRLVSRAVRLSRVPRSISRGRLLMFIGLVVAGGFLALQVGRQVYQSYAISERAHDIRSEIAELRQQNVELREQLGFLHSDAYVTTEARRVSNLGAPDERVLIIPPGAEAALPAELRPSPTPMPMLEQWVELFFGG